jgi:hypothetical protein
MNGFGHLPNKTDQNTFVFYANASTSTSGSFQAWNVPEHAAFLHFTVIGGGGGGGGGNGGAAAASGRAGGAGGAAGGIVAVSIPAILLPKTLYLQVGFGGSPGTGSNSQAVTAQAGNSGTISYVCLYPEINAGSVLIQSSNTAPGGGGGGLGAASTGTAITLADTTNLKWLGIVGNTVAQTVAANSNTTTTPTSVTYAGLLTGGGAGGTKPANQAGTAGAGITMTSINSYITTTIAGGAGSSVGAGGEGSNGFFSWKPFISTGGAGGGATSFNAGGGNGGVGAYGCGGGGGGASNGAPGGTGGKGGDGLIIIAVS